MPALFRTFFLVVLASCFFQSNAYAGPAPAFSLKGDNGSVSLKKYRGKVVYLDFWASWCVPCRKSFPWMNEMQKKYHAKGFEVIGINLDESQGDAKNFLKQIPAHFTVAYDPNGVTPGKYHVEVMPTSFLIDRKGNLVKTHRGFKKSKADDVEAEIQGLIGK